MFWLPRDRDDVSQAEQESGVFTLDLKLRTILEPNAIIPVQGTENPSVYPVEYSQVQHATPLSEIRKGSFSHSEAFYLSSNGLHVGVAAQVHHLRHSVVAYKHNSSGKDI